MLMERALKFRRGRGEDLKKPGECRIAIVGVGGCGNNTINRLMRLGVEGAECIAVNTDMQHLEMVRAHRKILIGRRITRGFGAGNMPDVGREAMLESSDEMEELLSGMDIVFVTAGMGGGTGTGAAPVIAEIARRCGAIVIGVVTMPFKHEKGRFEYALMGLNEMRRSAHTTVIIDNNKLMEVVPELPLDSAFAVADRILANMVKGIVETIAVPSLINLDFADFKTIMSRGDVAIVGVGQGEGERRAEEAAQNALNHVLLDVDYKGASGALIHISGGTDMSLSEAVRAAEYVTELMDEGAMVIWGARVNPALNNLLRVTLILTGVKSPQILAGYLFLEPNLYNLEPYAGPEKPLGLDLNLYQMEQRDW